MRYIGKPEVQEARNNKWEDSPFASVKTNTYELAGGLLKNDQTLILHRIADSVYELADTIIPFMEVIDNTSSTENIAIYNVCNTVADIYIYGNILNAVCRDNISMDEYGIDYTIQRLLHGNLLSYIKAIGNRLYNTIDSKKYRKELYEIISNLTYFMRRLTNDIDSIFTIILRRKIVYLEENIMTSRLPEGYTIHTILQLGEMNNHLLNEKGEITVFMIDNEEFISLCNTRINSDPYILGLILAEKLKQLKMSIIKWNVEETARKIHSLEFMHEIGYEIENLIADIYIYCKILNRMDRDMIHINTFQNECNKFQVWSDSIDSLLESINILVSKVSSNNFATLHLTRYYVYSIVWNLLNYFHDKYVYPIDIWHMVNVKEYFLWKNLSNKE